MSNSDRFPLSDVVEQLRKEIAKAVSQSEGEDIRFKVNEIEVEVTTVIEKSASGNAGVDISVLKFGAGVDGKKADTQTIKLKLQPLTESEDGSGDNDVKISGRAKRISSNG